MEELLGKRLVRWGRIDFISMNPKPHQPVKLVDSRKGFPGNCLRLIRVIAQSEIVVTVHLTGFL